MHWPSNAIDEPLPNEPSPWRALLVLAVAIALALALLAVALQHENRKLSALVERMERFR